MHNLKTLLSIYLNKCLKMMRWQPFTQNGQQIRFLTKQVSTKGE